MEYICDKCPVCGSVLIREVEPLHAGGDTFHMYRCLSCDEEFSSRQRHLRRTADKKARLAGGTDTPSPLAPDTDGEYPAARIFRKGRESVAEIHCQFLNCRTSGTGILLPNGYVLTNAHILFDPDEHEDISIADLICARTEGGEPFDLEFVSADREGDMAVLKCENFAGVPIRFAALPPATGEKIYTLGNSKGEGLCIAEGLVSDARRMVRGREQILFTAIVTHGNSGGPLLNARGELLGMVTNGRRDAVGMNYAIPVPTLAAYLREVERREEIRIL